MTLTLALLAFAAPPADAGWEPPNLRINDHWFLERPVDGLYHTYFLEHYNRNRIPFSGQIGHAVSRDLVRWSYQGTVLADPPAGSPERDGYGTGGILEHDGKFHLFYHAGDAAGRTGIYHAVSTSPHLGFAAGRRGRIIDDAPFVTTLHGRPITCHYDHDASRPVRVGDWWYMAVPVWSDWKGAVALYRSRDLLAWEPDRAILKTDEKVYCETPQLYRRGGRWLLVMLQGTTRVWEAAELFDPYRQIADFGGEEPDRVLSVVAAPEGGDVLLGGWNGLRPPSRFLFDPAGRTVSRQPFTPPQRPTTPPPAVVTLDDRELTFGPGWSRREHAAAWRGTVAVGRRTGLNYRVPFDGNQISLFGPQFPGAGPFEVMIDGTTRATVDQSGPTRVDNVLLYESPRLPPGPHVLTVRLVGDRRPEATAAAHEFDRVQVRRLP